MPPQPTHPYTPLFYVPHEEEVSHDKKRAILAVQEFEKNINAIKEKINQAKQLLNSRDNISVKQREKLTTIIRVGNENLKLHEPELKNLQERIRKLC